MQGAHDERQTQWWVVALCAEWCGVCREWHPAFSAQARAHPRWRFAWVDVEDESEAMGEVDIETFPTLLVAHGNRPLFFGPIPPSGPGLARLLASLQAQPQPAAGLSAAAGPLLRRLSARVLARSLVA